MEKKIPIFLAGLIIGASISACVMLKFKFSEKEISLWKSYSFGSAGELLDSDRLILKRGDVLVGRVLSENKDRVLFTYGNATVEFRRDEISGLERNYYTRYLKAVL